jgi:hypothetical protein
MHIVRSNFLPEAKFTPGENSEISVRFQTNRLGENATTTTPKHPEFTTLGATNHPLNPWRYRLWRTLAGWAAAAGSLSRLHQTMLGWHVVSTSNPTAAFSAFQTGPLLLYSSNYSVFPIMRLSGPRSRPNSLRKILRSARESNPGPLCL